MMYSKRYLPDIEQWSQISGSNVIPRRARPGLAGLRPHKVTVWSLVSRPQVPTDRESAGHLALRRTLVLR